MKLTRRAFGALLASIGFGGKAVAKVLAEPDCPHDGLQTMDMEGVLRCYQCGVVVSRRQPGLLEAIDEMWSKVEFDGGEYVLDGEHPTFRGIPLEYIENIDSAELYKNL